jgi:hypothetical protein
MTTSPALPRRQPWLFGNVRRMNKPALSRLILTATAFLVALVLLIWLLLFLLFRRTGGIDGWYVAQTDLAAPVLPFQETDLARLANANLASRKLGVREVEQTLRDLAASPGGAPVVVYLSAAGFADGARAALLPEDPRAVVAPKGAEAAGLSVGSLLEALGEAPSRPKLLILDAGQIGSDRNLGIFANDFLYRLAADLKDKGPKNLAVLCSCAPSQTSWVSEADGRSVFGHFVALGLTGEAAGFDPESRGLTVHALANYVREQVSRWVATHRGAKQTPVLLGDPAVNFTLRQLPPARVALAEEPRTKETEEAFEQLWAAWDRRDTLERRMPFRHTPALWRRYLETLLHAERLLRAHQVADASARLKTLDDLERQLGEGLRGLPMEGPWSLALGATRSPETETAHLSQYTRKIDQVLDELAGAVSVPAAESPKVEAEPPTKPAAETAPATKKEIAPKAQARDEGPKKNEPTAQPPAAPSAAKEESSDKEKGPSVQVKDIKHAEGEMPAGPSASTLAAERDDSRPTYLEGQLLVWVGEFQKLGQAPHHLGAPNFFQGPRGRALRRTVRVRFRAEEAAASEDRIIAWIMPWVDAGDALRRQAQDQLFANDEGLEGGAPAEPIEETLRRAETLYQQALDDAELYGQALDLVERLDSELPYLGAWAARRNARLGQAGLGAEFERLLTEAAVLAQLFADAGRSESDDPLKARAARVRALRDQAERVRADYDQIRAEFLNKHCKDLAEASSPDAWREIDEVLLVPLIPAKLRRPLFERAHRTLAGRLATALTPGRPEGSSKSATAKDLEDPQALPDADPAFWAEALGLARLEWGLMALGSPEEDAVDRLKQAYQSARAALGGEPATLLEAFDAFSALLRAERRARVGLVERVRSSPSTSDQSDSALYRELFAADRAARTLPALDVLPWTEDPATAKLDRFRRYALLFWHGRRLLDDFAIDHARLVLKDANRWMSTQALGDAIDKAEQWRSSRVAGEVVTGAKLTLDDVKGQPLVMSIRAEEGVPQGLAAVLVGSDPDRPVAVTVAPSKHTGREGTLVPIGARKPPARAEFQVTRTDFTPERVDLELGPAVFYRGHFFPSNALTVTLSPLTEPVSIALRQSKKYPSGIRDQFELHPGQGYMHANADLGYRLVLKNNTPGPLKLRVSYGLENDPPKTATLTLKKNETNDTIVGRVHSSELPPDRPRDLVVTLQWEGLAEPIARRFPFQQIPPARYMAAKAFYNAVEGAVYVWVTRLKSDPVTDPEVPVVVMVQGHMSPEFKFERRGWTEWFGFYVVGGQLVEKIPWSVMVESIPHALSGEVDTHVIAPAPVPTGATAPGAPPAAGASAAVPKAPGASP